MKGEISIDLIKKGATGENKITRDLFSSIIETFNGYELIKNDLKGKEKEDFQTIDIFYEPVGNENELLIHYFTGNIHLAYRSYVNKKVKGEDKISNLTARQCHYFVCVAKEGIVYTFENGKIISFQDNFRYLGDVPFTVYFDFETTTGDVVLLCPKIFFVSYFQIYSVHPSLKKWSFLEDFSRALRKFKI